MDKQNVEHLKNSSLIEKIRYIMANSNQTDWSASEMIEELNKYDLLPWSVTVIDVADVMSEHLYNTNG